MKYFKDKNGQIYAYDKDTNKNYLRLKIKSLGLSPLSKDEVLSIESKTPTIEEFRDIKSSELKAWVERMSEKCPLELKNFGVIDGGYKYLLNIRAMRDNFDLLSQKAFRMFDNSFKEITQEDLGRIERGIQLGGIKLHTLKWEYERAILEAKSVQDLEAMKFDKSIKVEL